MRRSPLYNEGVYAIALGSGIAAFYLLLRDIFTLPDVLWIPIALIVCGAAFSIVVCVRERQNPLLPLGVAAVLSAIIFGVIYLWIGRFI